VLLKLAAAAAVALALVACGGAKKAAAPKSDLPPGCTVAEVDGIVTSFLAQPRLAPPEMFQVYATDESDGRKYVTHSRAAALAHLRAREAAGEQQRLIQLRVAAQDVNHVRVTFELTRHAPDFAKRGIHSRIANGAGTIDCAHQLVAAWVVKGP
jgi:hypothetical protein